MGKAKNGGRNFFSQRQAKEVKNEKRKRRMPPVLKLHKLHNYVSLRTLKLRVDVAFIYLFHPV
jgi:hypothetical protein